MIRESDAHIKEEKSTDTTIINNKREIDELKERVNEIEKQIKTPQKNSGFWSNPSSDLPPLMGTNASNATFSTLEPLPPGLGSWNTGGQRKSRRKKGKKGGKSRRRKGKKSKKSRRRKGKKSKKSRKKKDKTMVDAFNTFDASSD